MSHPLGMFLIVPCSRRREFGQSLSSRCLERRCRPPYHLAHQLSFNPNTKPSTWPSFLEEPRVWLSPQVGICSCVVISSQAVSRLSDDKHEETHEVCNILRTCEQLQTPNVKSNGSNESFGSFKLMLMLMFKFVL